MEAQSARERSTNDERVKDCCSLSFSFRTKRGDEEQMKREADERRYKDVRPASLDVRQRGTPELEFVREVGG